MEWLLISLFLSVVFVVAIFFAGKYGPGSACLVAGLGTVLSFFVVAPILILQCFATFVLTGASIPFRAKLRTIMACSLVAFLFSYGIQLQSALHRMSEFARIREMYPVESLEGRLAHEQNRGIDAKHAGDVPLAVNVATQLKAFEEERLYGSSRAYMLERIHSQTRADFVAAQGFGVSRMVRIRPKSVELPDAKPIPLPEPVKGYKSDGTAPPRLADQTREDDQSPKRERLLAMHLSGIYDFLDKPRMGYVQNLSHVAGFVPHQFRDMPKMGVEQQWRITRLELISLLRHKTPVAYVSKNLPDMEKLKDAPTRPLNEFEQSALSRLRHDEDLVINDGLNKIRMVGSLRAAQGCLECHSVRRGELLGAFTYDIMRLRPLPEPDDKTGDRANSVAWASAARNRS